MTRSRQPPIAVFLPSLDGGGAERAMLNLAAGLDARGIATDLVLASATGPYLRLVQGGVRVVDLEARGVLWSLPPLVTYLKRERPRALLSALDHASVVALTAARLSGVRPRTIVSVQCTFDKSLAQASVRGRSIPWLLGRLHSWADAIVGVSEGVADDVARTIGISRSRVCVIHNPVITPTLMPAAAEPPFHPWFRDGAGPVVLGVGRLTAQKNFGLLIDAFAMVAGRHNARLVILGRGEDRHLLEARIQRHGLQDRVLLPGFVDNPYSCMARAAVFALSSDFEGLPTVLIESLALGTPVVATDCESGPREILRGGALGHLVPIGNVGAFAHALDCTLENPRPAVPAEALRAFTLDAVVDRFVEAFHIHA